MAGQRHEPGSAIDGVLMMKSGPIRLCRVVAGLLFMGMVFPSVPVFGQPVTQSLGYVPDDPEPPGAITHVPRFRAFLPAFKDLSGSFPPPGNQGRQNSCVAWSLGYALRGYYYHRRTQAQFSDASNMFSPAFIYNQLITTSDCLSGTKIKDALDLMKTEGIATLADFPYDDKTCVRKPNDMIKQHAATNLISGYRSFGQTGQIKPDDVKGALLAGDPVEIGMNIDAKALTHLRRGEIYDQDGPSRFEGHAMVVTGYDDRIQAFKVINSWGTKWADDGFGWISYRAFSVNTHAAFVVNDGASFKAPTPAPSPKPVTPPLPIPPPAPVASAAPDLTSLARMIDTQAKGFVCSRLEIRRSSATDAALHGWVADQANLDSLNNLLRAAPPGSRVTSDVRLRPWPQCEALMTLSDGVSGDHGMTITTVDHPGTEFESGTRLVMQVKTPDFPSYLYVTYIPANGDAVLLYKPRGIVPQALPPRTVVNLGGGDDPRVFKIGPPYGAEMVIAVATASPLFTDGIPASATERDYLTALRKTLLYKPDPKQPDRVVDASALALTTRDHGQ